MQNFGQLKKKELLSRMISRSNKKKQTVIAFFLFESEKTNSKPPEKRRKSKYVNIYCRPNAGKWCANLYMKGISYYCGVHVDETDAALAVNKKCEELGEPPKFPELKVTNTLFY